MEGEHLAGRGSGRRLGRRAERMERAMKAGGVREETRREEKRREEEGREQNRRGRRGEEEAEGPMVLMEAADWLWPCRLQPRERRRETCPHSKRHISAYDPEVILWLVSLQGHTHTHKQKLG